ncbi:DNA-3-methyladenine glycosylase 2 family protein [Metabacillus sp. KIGAM252]|uniref:DNA-3-methyladenine glycosylase II n=1 Tax=Metabacillus flavus TaxID=2823519 RepID=A0ABS5LB69_9BACI|nr:DNA-3-methyladenine glycosylase [Metabacillus flavus]MBS2967788.1 DNA-3-methyladenine glycosylase 2 family protein [Metabacillus flavus]
MWQEQVQVTPPYDFDRVLERLAIDPLNTLDLDERYVKVPLRLNGFEPHVITVQATGSKKKPAFTVSGKTNAVKSEALKEVRRIFQWDRELSAIGEHFKSSAIAQIFEEHEGTPLVLDFSLYGSLIKCIIHQQLNMAFAMTLTMRFVKTYGEEVDGVWFHPHPEKSAAIPVTELRELQFSGRKAEYITGISAMIASGELDLNKLHDQTDEEIMNELIKIKGIGPWTVQNILLFGLGRPNLFPIADIGIQNALKQHFNLDAKPTKEDMLAYSKEWEPYLSYASLYLWRSIEKRTER